ncbi:hypothetical protein ACIQ6K_38370 [Streptomyces sp. NPDC096354]|uniref:hypothetical protein n=1 Tax=Streptomyces sp. NPDC096354 TaxID=3366088 RepID=UPI0037F967D9
MSIALLQAGVLATYSYVAPLLTERAGLPDAVVPLAMLGYGVGALAGTTLGGHRGGDKNPWTTVLPAALLLGAITLWATSSAVVVALIVLLGFFGIIANPILDGQVVRIAGADRSLPMALATSWINVGIATGSWIGGLALATSLDLKGPSLAGLVLALLPIGACWARWAGRTAGR